jgi:hypothetical protein
LSKIDLAGTVVGTSGVTSPLWFSWLDGADKFGVAVGGLIVLALTGAKLWTELQIRRRELAKLKQGA